MATTVGEQRHGPSNPAAIDAALVQRLVGGVTRSGDVSKAIACGADAVMIGSPLARATDAPGRGYHWGSEAHHGELPRGERMKVGTVGTLEEILLGPSRVSDGSMNFVGALRRAMATTGYSDLKEFQRVEVTVSA